MINIEGGYLELIIGPMFSGKTSKLLSIKRMYDICDISCCVVNYFDDKRYHDSKLSTHNKDMIDCFFLKTLESLLIDYLHYKVFLINEGQFFDDIVDVVTKLVDLHQKKVYICGLDGDYKRMKFGKILDLIPLCDKVIKKSAICKLCKNGSKGIFTKRLTNEKNQKIIGSNNYIPICRKCFLKNDLN